jgi:adenine-specific DNA methylase
MSVSNGTSDEYLLHACLKGFASRSDTPKSQAAKIHKYWSRKPEQVLQTLIASFSSPGGTVMDPFCGSGAVGLEALRAGRKFVGLDLNPMAVRVTSDTLSIKFDKLKFDTAYETLEKSIAHKINSLFSTSLGTAAYLMPNSKSRTNAMILLPSGKKQRARLDLNELPKVRLTESESRQLPKTEFPEKFYKDRFSYKGVKRVTDLFSRRVLKALAVLGKEIRTLDSDVRPMFELCLTNTLLHVSKLKSEQVRPLGVNNYWIPDDFIEENVWWRFSDRCRQYRKAKLALQSSFADSQVINFDSTVSVGDAQRLSMLEDESVNFVLTDPPYGDAIQYSELSFVWNAWIGERFETTSEIVVNPCQDKNVDVYLKMLDNSFAEIRRVLKTDGFLTLSFQNKDLGLWCKVADSLRAHGFQFQDIFADRMLGSPFTKNWAEFSPKSDLYLTVKKSGNVVGRSESCDFTEILESVKRVTRRKAISPDRSYDFLAMRLVCDSLAGYSISFGKNLQMSSVIESLAH